MPTDSEGLRPAETRPAQSQLKNRPNHHHHLVFIRRPERPQYILRGIDPTGIA
jgi:hypothetical protein